MLSRLHLICVLICVIVVKEFSGNPILTDEENLKSIVISEIDLPTEATILEKEELVEPEKMESFAELYEKYDEQFIKNANTEAIVEGENPLQKRNLSTDVGDIVAEENSKSVMETIEKIVDPEVRKEFEQELSNSGQARSGGESSKLIDTGTEYDPNYTAKVINVGETANATVKLSHDIVSTGKEVLVEDHEAGLVGADSKMPNVDFVTESPEDFTSLPEMIEVVEQILHLQDSLRMSAETTADPLSVRVEVFDPIVVVSKERESFRSIDDEVTTAQNDKFVGFEPTDDLVQPGEETTERDHFFKKPKDSSEKAVNMLVDTFEFMEIYGKSLNDEIGSDITTSTVDDLEEATTVEPFVETKTEIVEVHTEISVSFGSEDTSKMPEIKDDVKPEIIVKPEKIDEPSKPSSSEESNSSKSDEKKDKNSSSKSNKSSSKSSDKSSESSEENNAKEVFDVDSKIAVTDTPQALVEDNRNTLNHEVIKKDHPAELSLPQVAIQKLFEVEEEIARHLEEKLKPEEPTTVGIFDTLEDIVTTVSDGIKLSNEFSASIDSFRGHTDENKTVLDTNSEAISSKNIANSLVNIAEEMTLEDHIESVKSSGLYGALIVLASTMTLVVLCVIMVKRFARMGVSLRLH